MGKKEQSNHIHKLRRHRYSSGNITYFCALPDCRFKITPALALGKRCICWRCGEDFILNEYAIRLAKPHCENCHKPKKEVDIYDEDAAIRIVVNDEAESVTILPTIPTKSTASDLRSRLTSIIHKAEDEGDI